MKGAFRLSDHASSSAVGPAGGPPFMNASRALEQSSLNRDEVARLLRTLHGPEVDVIRMFYLEGKSYREISSAVGMPENSIGPTLSRARAKMRQSRVYREKAI